MQSKLFAVCRECVTTWTSILSFPVLPPMDLETFLVSRVYNVQATRSVCKAVTGLATFSARIVIYLMLIRRAGT